MCMYKIYLSSLVPGTLLILDKVFVLLTINSLFLSFELHRRATHPRGLGEQENHLFQGNKGTKV